MRHNFLQNAKVQSGAKMLLMFLILLATTSAYAQVIEWTSQFGTSRSDYASAVAAAGNAVYVAGSVIVGAFPGATSAGKSDVFVSKLDLDGKVLWTKQFGTAEDDAAQGVAADATGVYVVGYTHGALQGASSGGSDIFVRK